jgi:hypothetical protein
MGAPPIRWRPLQRPAGCRLLPGIRQGVCPSRGVVDRRVTHRGRTVGQRMSGSIPVIAYGHARTPDHFLCIHHRIDAAFEKRRETAKNRVYAGRETCSRGPHARQRYRRRSAMHPLPKRYRSVPTPWAAGYSIATRASDVRARGRQLAPAFCVDAGCPRRGGMTGIRPGSRKEIEVVRALIFVHKQEELFRCPEASDPESVSSASRWR